LRFWKRGWGTHWWYVYVGLLVLHNLNSNRHYYVTSSDTQTRWLGADGLVGSIQPDQLHAGNLCNAYIIGTHTHAWKTHGLFIWDIIIYTAVS
jgi:hypothetical protein